MNNTQKIVTFAVLAAMPIIANAGFMAYYPLEVKLGGSLPDGSINMGNGNGTPTDPTGPTEPNGNCEYDGMSKLAMFKVANGPFAAGDVLLLYRGKLIGAQSPSNGLSVPAGITSGQIKLDTPEVAEAEICGDNLSSYPTIPIPTGTPPVDDNAITFTDTITSNSCPEARAEHNVTCSLDGAHVSQTMDLQLDDSYGIIIYTDFLSPEDRAKLSTATTISTNTGKSCLIDKIYENGVSCYNKTLILENETGSTITFTIK
jgi:hypothetical protein